MPTLSSLAAPEVVIMTTSGATRDDKVGIMTTLSIGDLNCLLHLICERLHQMLIYISELILGLHSANERRRYKVTASLIGWAQT